MNFNDCDPGTMCRQIETDSTWSGGLHTYACAKIDKMRKNQICLHNNI